MSLMVTSKCKIKDLAPIVAMTVSDPIGILHEAVNICIWRLVGRFCLEIQIELKDNEGK